MCGLALVAIGALVAGACFDGGFLEGRPCESTLDCGARLECIDNVCGGVIPPHCGNGQVDPGEDCDPADIDNPEDCPADCLWPVCGDGVIEGAEECEDGNGIDIDDCTNECVWAVCGDGVVQQGVEQCDDGNDADDDDCTNDCKLPNCGDGVVDGLEECDDANIDTADGCVHCKHAVCGDGHVQTGVEECDDANGDNGDACLDTCAFASCGDGHVHTAEEGLEECDDGNEVDDDECTNACRLPSCEDNLLNGDETDVDCGNSCPACKHGHSCDDISDCAGDSCTDGVCQGSFALSTGQHFTCVRLETGDLRCWGRNTHAQLGYGSFDDVTSKPVCGGFGEQQDLDHVPLGDVGVVQAGDGGFRHNCVITDAGSVRCWGNNQNGELGYGVTGGSFTSTMDDLDLDLDPGELATALALGDHTTCLLTTTNLGVGRVRCWGWNTYGQLGDGTTVDQNSAADAAVLAFDDSVSQIVAGRYHGCVLLESAQVYCWGRSAGTGQPNLSVNPIEVQINLPDGAQPTFLAAGGYATCALTTAETNNVVCWGNGAAGQLGHDGVFDVLSPIDEATSIGDRHATTISVGNVHTCAGLSGDPDQPNLLCWGSGGDGRLGAKDPDLGTKVASTLDARIEMISAAYRHTCVLLDSGALRCFGPGANGQLGYGSLDPVFNPHLDVPYYLESVLDECE